MSRIKNAAITRIGFKYQDYLAAEFLVDFYQNSQLYQWIELESEEDGSESLDDIVALRKEDSRYVMHQVKFTVDPNRDDLKLSFDWLLELPKKTKRKKGAKKKRGKPARSLLQKWAPTVLLKLENNQLYHAALKTNRKPDAAFSKALNKGGFLDKKRIPKDIWQKIASQIGSEKDALVFIKNFSFEHSLEEDERVLYQKIRDRLVPDYTDETGVLRFKTAIEEWSCYRKKPLPDGKIRYEHLANLLSRERPKPMPQNFKVPNDYVMPNREFHKRVCASLGKNKVLVITGAPGRGKSTYLSFLAKHLLKKKYNVARHHYFLSHDDTTSDRYSFVDVSHSIESQIESIFPALSSEAFTSPRSDRLREYLTYAGRESKKKKKPFVLILDGLDHVWRERDDIGQMQHLFSRVFPIPDNVVVLLGTQPVPDEQLPTQLCRIPRNRWHTLPSMGIPAISEWLNIQRKAKRFKFWYKNKNIQSSLSELADAFFQISNGHPLHLIYSFEAAIYQNPQINPDTVLKMPKCVDGEIGNYYRALWRKLSDRAREILYLCAVADFNWPEAGLLECLGKKSTYLGSLSQVQHLLEKRPSGLIPFHGSLLVYIRGRSDYKSAEAVFLPQIVRWLKNKAPEYYQWGWLWLMQARNGQEENLIKKPTKMWAVESMCKGYPLDQIENIFDKAEFCCLKKSLYARLVELRSIKNRVQNGPQFQVHDYPVFKECAVKLSSDNLPLVEMADNLPLIEDDELLLVVQALSKDRPELAGQALDEMNERLFLASQEQRNLSDMQGQHRVAVQIAARANIDVSRVVRFILGCGGYRNDLLEVYLHTLMKIASIDQVLSLIDAVSAYPSLLATIEKIYVRYACIENLDIAVQSNFQTLSQYPLTRCWAVINGRSSLSPKKAELAKLPSSEYDPGKRISYSRVFYNHFLTGLNDILFSSGETNFIPRKPEKDIQGLVKAFEKIDDFSRYVADRVRNKERLGVQDIFNFFNDFQRSEFSSDFDGSEVSNAFQSAINLISIDLCLLLKITPTDDDLSANENCVWWSLSFWLRQYSEKGFFFLREDAARYVANKTKQDISKNVSEFVERSNDYLALTKFSIDHGLQEVAREALTLTATCILGYGGHKDITIFDVLKSIKYCGQEGIGDMKAWLKNLDPLIINITDYTDGDETSHAHVEYAELLATYDRERFLSVYKRFLQREDWYYVDRIQSVLMESLDTSNKYALSFVRSITSDDALYALQERAKEGDLSVRTAYEAQSLRLGRKNPWSEKKDSSTYSKEEKKPHRISFRKYPPENIKKLIGRINKLPWSSARDDVFSEWLLYWEQEGQGLELVAAIQEYFPIERDFYYMRSHLDSVFELFLRVKGKGPAYPWIVSAHRENYGWNRYWSSKGTQRLKRVSEVYKRKWNKYIQDTSGALLFEQSKISIGRSELVQFLLLVGQKQLALEVTKSMIASVLNDMADQPIGEAT